MSEYLEQSIEEYVASPSRKLSDSELFIQMFDIIKEIHEAGFVYKDIKPEHFRMQNH